MKVDAYIKSAATVLAQYEGKIPFASWLKEYFRKEKKFGSRDRRTVSALCYGYFRLGSLRAVLPVEERIRLGAALADGTTGLPEDPLPIFPLHHYLSSEIEKEAFALSHLQQPDLFLRLRPGKEAKVKAQLEEAGIAYKNWGSDCLALPNGSKVDEILMLDRDAVVQDLSSQKVLDLFTDAGLPKGPLQLWDCCAASGGKSILAKDQLPGVQLTVSDIRESILINLRKRFERAGVGLMRSFVADVGAPDFCLSDQFDIVLCDAPCSGSGTWGRTPEQLTGFTEDRIGYYAGLQQRIAVNAAGSVKSGGYFLYATCSVFAAENEEVVAHLQKNTALTLQSARYFKGYGNKADTLFAALFRL